MQSNSYTDVSTFSYCSGEVGPLKYSRKINVYMLVCLSTVLYYNLMYCIMTYGFYYGFWLLIVTADVNIVVVCVDSVV